MPSKILIPEDVKIKYIERRKIDLLNCHKALSDLNFDFLSNIGHQIKGNAVTFGYSQLEPLAIEMESLAIAKDTKNLSLLLARIDECLSQL